MARLLLIAALVALVLWVFSIVDCALQPRERHRGVGKTVWVLIVVLLPVVGGVLWFVVGRVSARAAAAAGRAPDDDPAFLRSLGGGATARGGVSAQDERIRRLEEDLARLEDEGDPDSGTAR
ncbi:MAG: PLDc N-terminal domain-containing protein [Microbacterium sp.]